MSYEEALEQIKSATKTGATRLDLRHIKLEYLPPEIGQLTSLKSLRVDYNHLVTLPSEIGQLASLENLYLSDNRLTTLPPKSGNWLT